MDNQNVIFEAEFDGFAQRFMMEFSTEKSGFQSGESANQFNQLMNEAFGTIKDSDNKIIKNLVKQLDFQSVSDEESERVIPASMENIVIRVGNPKCNMNWGRILYYYKFVEQIMNGPFQIMSDHSKDVLFRTSTKCLEKILVENHDWINANGGWKKTVD
uniref:Uncharacterized protein n=1 Tax=Clytia hemisphaerica TaxID=252671 RepID=A0A7M5XC54_9CNID